MTGTEAKQIIKTLRVARKIDVEPGISPEKIDKALEMAQKLFPDMTDEEAIDVLKGCECSGDVRIAVKRAIYALNERITRSRLDKA